MRLVPVVVAAALAGAGCLVDVRHVSDPEPAFRQAHSEAEREQGRKGPAHQLNVLTYDPGDEELTRVSLPLWLCKKLHDRVDWDDEHDEHVARVVSRHVTLDDLAKAGPGILVEVEEEDGERVLVWLK